MPREPEVLGLLALMLLHESRAATRFDGWGRLVRLADQDRARWDGPLIAEATGLLDQAIALRGPVPIRSRRPLPRCTRRRRTTSRPTGARSACCMTGCRN